MNLPEHNELNLTHEPVPGQSVSSDAATEAQLNFLKSMGYTGPADITKEAASKEIDRLKKLPRDGHPATEKQINFLRTLGYTGPANISKGQASKLIEELKGKVDEKPSGPDEHVPDWL